MVTNDLLPGSLITDNKTATTEASSGIVPKLIGTWNFVNSSETSNIGSMNNMSSMNMNMTGTSGKITFSVSGWEAGDVGFQPNY